MARQRAEYAALAPPQVVEAHIARPWRWPSRVSPVLVGPDLGVPSEGLRLRCRRGRHRLKIMKEAELRELIRRLPISATVLYLPAA